MNKSIVFYLLGWIMIFVGTLMLLPFGVSLLYAERISALSFLTTIAICLLIGISLVIKKPKNNIMYLKEGFVITALSWIIISIMGSMPFVISGCYQTR